MYGLSAKYYDKLYHWKDYKSEAATLDKLIKKTLPEAKSILDVGCGTHEHALYLKNYRLDGVDINQDFIDIAQVKNPNGKYFQSCMSEFTIDNTYDVVTCLFSSIGFCSDEDMLAKTIRNFAKHTKPGGIIIVEPWFPPEGWNVGHPSMFVVDEPDFKLCRMSVSAMEGALSKIDFHYLLTKKNGVEHFTEKLLLGLFTKEQMIQAFQAADLAVEYLADGLMGRGLYVGNKL